MNVQNFRYINNFPKLSENIQALMAARESLLCFHPKQLYAQFRNDAVGRRKVFFCIQEIRQS